MPLPDKPICSICNGEEAIFLNDYDMAPCQCLLARLWRRHLDIIGSGISSAPTILHSPLFMVKEGEVEVDRTKDNLFISAHWYSLLPHLKLALFCKGMGFRSCVISDEKLLSVYLGKESYAARPKRSRDDGPTFNNLADIMGSDHDLVILRLGRMGYKNIAAAGILKEALMIREGVGLPTWLVEEGEGAFSYTTCHSFSDDVFGYILRHFDRLTIDGSSTPRSRQIRESGTEVTGNEDPADILPPRASVHTPEPEPEPVARRPTNTHSYSSSEEDDGMPGSNRKKNFKKKKSGGGPI